MRADGMEHEGRGRRSRAPAAAWRAAGVAGRATHRRELGANDRKIVAGALLVLLAFLVFFGWKLRRPSQLPDELMGTWTTDAPQYEDRTLEFHQDFIFFGLGGDQFTIQHIVKVKKEAAGAEDLYTVSSYGLDNDSSVLSFYFSPADGGTLRFKNQKIVWKKRTAPPG